MKTEEIRASVEPLPGAVSAGKSWTSVWGELIKLRLNALVLLTTLLGFYVGSPGPLDRWRLLHTLLGTALMAAGASALNQLMERDLDAKMTRTQDRPLPSGRLQPATVLIFGGLCGAVGLVYLAVVVNPLTGLLGAITLVCYLFVYTPLKRVTTLNTVVGAIPGALPPLMGWAAACGEVSLVGWSLFAIQFFWQLPHFLAIAWLYRDDYARAGFKMLPVLDPAGERTAYHAISHTLGLLTVSLSPFLFGLAGPVYLLGALLLGGVFLGFAIRFARQLTRASARWLFWASLIYLPLVLGLIVTDKVR